jgi:hypothetical protein
VLETFSVAARAIQGSRRRRTIMPQLRFHHRGLFCRDADRPSIHLIKPRNKARGSA